MSDGNIIAGTICIVLFFTLYNPYSFYTVVVIIIASTMGCFAFYLLNEAAVHGKAGPSLAIAEIAALWLLMLEIIFLSQVPTWL
jgi:hypothetical protein